MHHLAFRDVLPRQDPPLLRRSSIIPIQETWAEPLLNSVRILSQHRIVTASGALPRLRDPNLRRPAESAETWSMSMFDRAQSCGLVTGYRTLCVAVVVGGNGACVGAGPRSVSTRIEPTSYRVKSLLGQLIYFLWCPWACGLARHTIGNNSNASFSVKLLGNCNL